MTQPLPSRSWTSKLRRAAADRPRGWMPKETVTLLIWEYKDGLTQAGSWQGSRRVLRMEDSPLLQLI